MAERQSARMSKITNDQLNPVWQRMLHSCTYTATVCIKGLIRVRSMSDTQQSRATLSRKSNKVAIKATVNIPSLLVTQSTIVSGASTLYQRVRWAGA